MSERWWEQAVIYQIYPKSFADADGDGVGDLRGIRDRLPAVVDLGVDAIWLSPFYRSPQSDGGYDVSDHRDVDPVFGTMADFDALLDDAHRAGLRVIVDLVPNHTSTEHPWFREALSDEPGGPARARYMFRPGRGPGGERPPNDWCSVFGGPAWSRAPGSDGSAGQWYLHLFSPEQADLDWTNDEVASEFRAILGFWLDRGVDGFRIDVAHGLAKDPEMPDLNGRFRTAGLAEPGHPHWDRDEVHEVYRSWRSLADRYEGDRMFVAEAYLRSGARLADYVRPDELHTAFNFRFLLADWDPAQLREVIDDTIDHHRAVGAPPTWVLSNHDVARTVTRYGGGTTGLRRARAAALLMLALPGSAYVYAGEELGLPEVLDLPDEARLDPTFVRTGGVEPGRDGCRVPLPWDDSSDSCGFSPSGRSWLPQPAGWSRRSRATQQADPDSMLNLYRRAVHERRSLLASIPHVSFEWLGTGDDVLAFARTAVPSHAAAPGSATFVCVANLSSRDVDVADALGPEAHTVMSSDPSGAPGVVRPDSTSWFRTDPVQ